MEFFIIIVHVLAALGITGLVLIQHGKGADMGAAFGSGASQTMFGSVGTGNVLTKSTTWLAVVFFATSLGLAVFARQQADQGIQDSGLIQNVDQLQDLISTDVPPQAQVDDDVPAGDTQLTDEQMNEAVQAVLDAVAESGGTAEFVGDAVPEETVDEATAVEEDEAAQAPPAE